MTTADEIEMENDGTIRCAKSFYEYTTASWYRYSKTVKSSQFAWRPFDSQWEPIDEK